MECDSAHRDLTVLSPSSPPLRSSVLGGGRAPGAGGGPGAAPGNRARQRQRAPARLRIPVPAPGQRTARPAGLGRPPQPRGRGEPPRRGLRRRPDRKSVVEGKSVSVRVDLGCRRIIKQKKTQQIVTKKN